MIKRLALFAVCVLAGSPVNVWSAEREIIKIGAVLPLTGGMEHTGAAFRDAALMAAEEERGRGRFDYRLIIEDDGLQPAKASTAAHKLIDIDKADALISTWSYGGIVIAPLAERAKKLHIGIAWDPAVAKGSYNFLHLAPPRNFVAKFFEAFEVKGYRKIAAVGWHESGSLFFLDEVDRLAPANGFEVVRRTEFQGGENDFRSALLSLAQAKPDVVVANLTTPAIDIFVRQMSELRLDIPITSITGFETAVDLKQLEGKWYVSDATPPEEFIEKFRRRYGHNQEYGVANYYDAVKLLIHLFESAAAGHEGKPSADDLLRSAKNIDRFSSVYGKLSVDSEGIISYEPVFRKIKDGKRITVGLDGL